jgi:hypothetical protein
MCVVHAVRTGRDRYWIWIILVLPGLGCVAYFVAELLPELMGTKQARGVAKAAVKAIDPDRDYRKLVDNLDTADTADNKRKLAEEYIERGNPDMAVTLLESALAGPLADDPALLYGMARARFAAKDFAGSEATLLRLHQANDKFRAAEAHLLFARALEGQNKLAEALAEYDKVAAYFPGAEARCRYAALLRDQGQDERARGIFAEVVRGLDKAGKGFIRDQREWYDFAKRHLA